MKTSIKKISKEKENGRIYTPKYIVRNILDLSGYAGQIILKKHVIDNSCGDGAFLIEIVKRYCIEAMKAGYSCNEIAEDLSLYIHGIELDKSERDKCIDNVNCVTSAYNLPDIEWDIICGNTLAIDCYNGKMDFVLGNPPYVRVHNLGDSFEEIKSFSFAQGGMTDLFIVFYEIGLRMLNQNGVLGYITPSSFFSSVAGYYMRRQFINNNYLEKIVNLKHFQAFNATTYTTIAVLRKRRKSSSLDYYEFDTESLTPLYVDTLMPDDFYIAGNYYFSKKENLSTLKKIYNNIGKCSVLVKNGYATLCDSVFIHNFDFDSPFIIPVIKSSKGIQQKIFYPYDKNAKLISLDVIKTDPNIYNYLMENKNKLNKRSNDNNSNDSWYAFGRSQALLDTYHDKLAINSLLRKEEDFKFTYAPAGVGVYGGLYIVSDEIPIERIQSVLKSKDFITYISLLGKYKSGGYYTFSSKDVKLYLDYIFAYDGGLFNVN